MSEDAELCPTCGASWTCEHRADPLVTALREIAPDGPTLAQPHADHRDAGAELSQLC